MRVDLQECVMCGARVDYDDRVGISRCCCDADYVCMACVETRSLREYVVKQVEALPRTGLLARRPPG